MFQQLATLFVVLGLLAGLASASSHYNDRLGPHHRVKRGDFYGPGGLGAPGPTGYGGSAFGFSGSSFNPVLFQGAAVAGGFAKEAYNANTYSLAGADGLLSGGTFGVSYYANAIASAAASNAAAGNKQGKGGLSYGRR